MAAARGYKDIVEILLKDPRVRPSRSVIKEAVIHAKVHDHKKVLQILHSVEIQINNDFCL
jgi:hypothetical protein